MATHVTPGQDDMASQEALKNFIISQQGGVYRGARTTLSMTGSRQFNVTAYSLSDVMQGTMSVRGPEEMNLVINKALSNNLDYLYGSDYASVSAFSTAKYEFNPGTGAMDPMGFGNGMQGFMGGEWVGGAITGEEVAQIGYQVGFRGQNLVMLVAISKRESKWDPSAHNTNTETGDNSYGLMQINMLDELGPSRREQYGLTANEELFDPVTNLRAAFILSSNGTDFHHWGGYKGEEDNYNTDMAEAARVVESAKSQGLLGKEWVPRSGQGFGGGNMVGGFGNSANTQHSIEQIKAASEKVGRHPNNWMIREGGFASGAQKLFSSRGISPSVVNNGKPPPPGKPYDYPVYKANGYAWLMPSLLNYLWFIFEQGFILSNYLGSIGMKTSGGGSGPSLHCYGGAIDIGAIGHVSEGRTYGINAGNANARAIGDRLFNTLASVPKNVWADEHGCDWVTNYGSQGFHTYKDPGHIHLGFSPERSGTLIPGLLQ